MYISLYPAASAPTAGRAHPESRRSRPSPPRGPRVPSAFPGARAAPPRRIEPTSEAERAALASPGRPRLARPNRREPSGLPARTDAPERASEAARPSPRCARYPPGRPGRIASAGRRPAGVDGATRRRVDGRPRDHRAQLPEGARRSFVRRRPSRGPLRSGRPARVRDAAAPNGASADLSEGRVGDGREALAVSAGTAPTRPPGRLTAEVKGGSPGPGARSSSPGRARRVGEPGAQHGDAPGEWAPSGSA